MPEPKPLTEAQRRIFIGMLVLGIVVIVIGIILSSSNVAGVIVGGVLGMGGALLGMSLIQLFHRPDR
ncbi:MAG: hypothetical protein ACREQP_20915 [Candidatus Binatia bacterium]